MEKPILLVVGNEGWYPTEEELEKVRLKYCERWPDRVVLAMCDVSVFRVTKNPIALLSADSAAQLGTEHLRDMTELSRELVPDDWEDSLFQRLVEKARDNEN